MKNVYVMATKVEDGSILIGSASEVCTELWDRVPSGYPRHISAVLQAARQGLVYRGYSWQVLPSLPRVLSRRLTAVDHRTATEDIAC